MRNKIVLTTVLIGCCLGVSMFGQPEAQTGEASLRATMAERTRASLSGDRETMARSLADEYRQTDISGLLAG
jgi:hypothetical protein